MRILFVNSVRDSGGGATSAYELATGLAARGHDITVAAHPEGALGRRLQGQNSVRTAALRLRAELNLWRVTQLASLRRTVRPQVVLADRRKDVKFCVVALALSRTTLPPLVHRHGAPSVLKNSALYRFVWRHVRRMIVNSHAMRAAVLEATPWLFDVGVSVVHNGKDPAHWRPMPELRDAVRTGLDLPREAFVVCFHGELQARKNIDVLIEAVASGEAGPGVIALIVGDGPEAGALRSLAATRGAHVRWAGRRADVARVLAAADASVHLSSAEGFSNSVLEAMACGLPAIASNATSHPEQIRDGVEGLLVPARDAGAVARAIRRLASADVARHRMGERARERVVNEFSLERMLDGYEEVLGEVLGG
ncbi:MAG: glycosyltransferase family 4 protein [Gemmatimonadetes bacterium]|nr:glycosyltransferase family 4 protein [Gemmatimonadota bacterium]